MEKTVMQNISDMRDELKITDDDVFGSLRPEVDGLSDCIRTWKKRDIAGARAGFVEYFMNRKKPVWTFDWRDRGDCVQDPFEDNNRGTQFSVTPMERSKALLENVVVDAHGGHTSIDDLDAIPENILEHGAAFSFVIVNHHWVSELAEAWARTRDERYAEKLVELLHRFEARWPLRVTVPEPKPAWYNQESKPPWAIMPIGKTARNFLDALYTGVLSSSAFSADDRFLFLKTLWFFAFQFTWFTGKIPFEQANHHLFEVGCIPFLMGTMLHEFNGFPEMQIDGAKVINQHLQHDFLPSGAYMEHSTSYCLATMWMYTLPWTIARANDYRLIKPENRTVLKKWMGWLADVTRPDGVIGHIGDGKPRSVKRYLENAAALCADAEAKGLRCALPYGSGLEISRSLHGDYRSCETHLPPVRSAVYEDKAWIVLRDGWHGPDASHFLMSAPRPPYNHGHWDMGHFVLFTRGQSFIGDPASHIYNGYYDAERRGYLYSMGAHNVLTVDDDELMPKRSLYPIWTGNPPPCTVAAWHLGQEVDFVTIYHDGYAPKRHVREVLFKKHAYWLVLDYLTPDEPGTQPQCWVHTIRRFIHFSFGVTAALENGIAVARSGREALMIVPAGMRAPDLNICKDRILEPERKELGAAELPDVLEIRNKVLGPAVMALLIYPYRADKKPDVSPQVTVLNTEGGNPVRVEVKMPDSTDVWETYTLTAPDSPAEQSFGKITNTLDISGKRTSLPAIWSERARSRF
jgi:hypothetical protein